MRSNLSQVLIFRIIFYRNLIFLSNLNYFFNKYKIILYLFSNQISIQNHPEQFTALLVRCILLYLIVLHDRLHNNDLKESGTSGYEFKNVHSRNIL